MDQKSIYRLIAPLVFMLCLLVFVLKKRTPAEDFDATACVGPPLKNLQARNDAIEAGYTINRRYDCIDKESFMAVAQQKDAWLQGRKDAAAASPSASAAAAPSASSLAEARRGFDTRTAQVQAASSKLPRPPADLFVRTDYGGPSRLTLPAFVTPDPKDGQKHPAIIWLTGGDTNSLDDFWTPGPEINDQSARAFREAGMVMMFPTLRGGNENPGSRQYFLGEVDDVLAAADHLARLPYVDITRIYLGGHSTGGTLALLTAETNGRFKAVFAFGPVAEVDRYPSSLVPIHFKQIPADELKLRSPVHWLNGISTPTYLIEGKNAPGNIDDVEAMCRRSENPRLHCIPVEGENHFSVLAKVSKVIAARLVVEAPGVEFSLRAEEFEKKAGAD